MFFSRLDPTPPESLVPGPARPEWMETWLTAQEADENIIEGAEATIVWHNQGNGAKTRTDYCLLYLHGFSACRQETAPLADDIAEQLGANLVYARLAGHGLQEGAMQASAEDWLGSVQDAYEIAASLGRQVIIIATSTGAALALWVLHHRDTRHRVAGLIFCAPNFRVRNLLGQMLTWPGARVWLPWLVGRERHLEPENDMAARYWTHTYRTAALIEMQKVVNWARKHWREVNRKQLPLLTLYMKNDPVISSKAAIRFHKKWRAKHKELCEVTLDSEHPQHVFVGHITAPHRVNWVVKRCLAFLEYITTDSTQE